MSNTSKADGLRQRVFVEMWIYKRNTVTRIYASEGGSWVFNGYIFSREHWTFFRSVKTESGFGERFH